MRFRIFTPMQRGAMATNKRKPIFRQVRFPGLCNDAHALGVHRNHLYLVLAGKRVSADLMRRYRALKKEAT